MEYNIKEKKENTLLSRTELSIEIKHFGSANPSYENIKKEIANQLKADEKLIVIKHVYPAFGEGKSDVIAYIYKDEESLKKTEPRNKKAEAAAKKAAAESKEAAPESKEAAPAPAEKPKEAPAEKKEEKPAEEPPKEEAKPEGE
jgi:ribosomal protein S24E